jgi:hypothetical protein
VDCNLRRLIVQVVVTLVSTVPTTKNAQELLIAAQEATGKMKRVEEQMLRVLE